MSTDENQHLANDEIDLSAMLRSIWVYKFSLSLFLILSVPASITFTTFLQPKYKAHTIFEKPEQKSSQDSVFGNTEDLNLFSVLSGSVSTKSDSFYSEIRSESFLKTVILNNPELNSQRFKEFCPLPSKETSRSFFRSVLISLGISEDKAPPSESQKISLLVKCLNSMLEVDLDTYGNEKSSAYRLSITSIDPVFSANLANQIVEKYFIRHEKRREEGFQRVKKYLSKVISEAQLEFAEASKLMQSFIIKHTLNMKMKVSPIAEGFDLSLSLPPSPFAAKLENDVYSLSKLEKSLSRLKQARSELSSLTKLDRDKINEKTLSTEIQEVLSRTFVSFISKIDSLSNGSSIKNQDIKQIVALEVQSLNEQIEALQDRIVNRERQTKQLMTIENRYQELVINLSKKRLIFEGLKDQLTQKILSAGLANVEQPVLFTRAVPPFTRVSPNKLLIVILGFMLSAFAGIVYILIRQSLSKKIHSLSQVQNLSRFLSCYEIQYKQLKMRDDRSDKAAISQSFFSLMKEMGQLGCVVDLSQKKLNNSLASEFSKTVASLLATDSSKIVYLDNLPNKKPFSTNSKKNLVSDHDKHDSTGILSNSALSFNNEDGLIGAGEIEKIKNKYSDYEKIICALGADIGDLTKFKFIEQCDFYILIGRSFQFDEFTLKKFSNTVWEKEKKCLGFFLIA